VCTQLADKYLSGAFAKSMVKLKEVKPKSEGGEDMALHLRPLTEEETKTIKKWNPPCASACAPDLPRSSSMSSTRSRGHPRMPSRILCKGKVVKEAFPN
jgi:hypothetical protein